MSLFITFCNYYFMCLCSSPSFYVHLRKYTWR